MITKITKEEKKKFFSQDKVWVWDDDPRLSVYLTPEKVRSQRMHPFKIKETGAYFKHFSREDPRSNAPEDKSSATSEIIEAKIAVKHFTPDHPWGEDVPICTMISSMGNAYKKSRKTCDGLLETIKEKDKTIEALEAQISNNKERVFIDKALYAVKTKNVNLRRVLKYEKESNSFWSGGVYYEIDELSFISKKPLPPELWGNKK